LRLASKLEENQGWDFQIEYIKKKKKKNHLRVVHLWPILWWLGIWARTKGLLAMTIGYGYWYLQILWLWLLLVIMPIGCGYWLFTIAYGYLQLGFMAMAFMTMACDHGYWLL
jgi:hypothetical protein